MIMKRIPHSLLLILCLLLLLQLPAPLLKANVWISPMKILAEGYVTDHNPVYTEKNINLINDGNQTYIVTFQWTGISVLLENETIELQPFEKRIIKPNILIEKGNHTGTITVKANIKNSSKNHTGVQVISLSSIRVITRGYENTTLIFQTINSDVNQQKNKEYFYLPALIGIGIIIILIIYVLSKKKKKKKINNKKKP